MKKLAENSLRIAGLLAVLLLVFGCREGTFYTADLAKDQLLGTWVLSSFPENHQPPKPLEDCTLTFRKDGTFEAANFPMVMDVLPILKVKYTTEHGSWSLDEVGGADVRFRWKINLIFNQSRIAPELDITKGSSGIELFERTDLDFCSGYTLRRKK